MTDDDKIALARQIDAAGGSIYAAVPDKGGRRQVRVEPNDFPLFLHDGAGWVAKMCGVTADQLETYYREDRIPRCGGTTQVGRPCQNALASDSSPSSFAALHRQERCNVHV